MPLIKLQGAYVHCRAVPAARFIMKYLIIVLSYVALVAQAFDFSEEWELWKKVYPINQSYTFHVKPLFNM